MVRKNFIALLQAALQGCVIETPHSDDIRTIVGINHCADIGPIVSGFSNGQDCDESGTVVMNFSKTVTFTPYTGVSTPTQNGATITAGVKTFDFTVAAHSGKTATYTGAWSAALGQGDVVTWTYVDDDGDYAVDGEELADQVYVMTNCLDPTSNVGIVESWTGDCIPYQIVDGADDIVYTESGATYNVILTGG